MQSTRRLNKRQPVSVTALPIKVETTASPGNMTSVLSETSFQQPQYQVPAHLEQTHTHQDHGLHGEPLIKTANEPVFDNHNRIPYQQHSHAGYDNSYSSHNHDNGHIHNHDHHDHHEQQQHVEHSHDNDTGYGHQHNHTNDHHVAHVQPRASYHSHNGHGHGHEHHGHGDGHVHTHQDHDHDHHHHSHHGHDHNHNHNHAHGHDHDHAHGHEGHHHHHHHSYPPVFTPPLPSWSELFSTLSPTQKTVFTWFMIHSAIGIWVYCIGISNGALSVVGFSYLVIFDALGVLNSFISSIIRTSPSYGHSNTKRPFGAHRYEIIFAMATTVYLLFATMHNTKESLEHFLLEGHHGGAHHEESSSFGFGVFLAVSVAIGTCCLASVALRNHDNFVRFLRRTPPTVHGFSYNVVNRGRGNPINVILSNVYSSSIVSCGSLVLISNMLGLSSSSIDKLLALMESVVMFYLGYPTAKALANLLLQTTPNTVRNGVETRLYEIKQNPNIISVDRVHFWQNTYGRCVGTLEVQIRADAEEQAVLQFIYQKLEGLTSSGGDGYDDVGQPSELTVSIIKN
ncbi:cation efflux family-domain-containing protein [Absidia repens]|uniref:Cation efflux family-domain-containing protein n=1 Tax=Absidia repens TaxID=90262 RepID=A0A1X2I9F7_9FUNG|nr:cation efflux family-domain-containing protein [Absidia repens]